MKAFVATAKLLLMLDVIVVRLKRKLLAAIERRRSRVMSGLAFSIVINYAAILWIVAFTIARSSVTHRMNSHHIVQNRRIWFLTVHVARQHCQILLHHHEPHVPILYLIVTNRAKSHWHVVIFVHRSVILVTVYPVSLMSRLIVDAAETHSTQSVTKDKRNSHIVCGSARRLSIVEDMNVVKDAAQEKEKHSRDKPRNGS